MKKKILITGFEPFGGDLVNPSGDAVKAMTCPDTVEVKKMILPVSWHNAFPEIEKVWDEWKPDVVLHVGVAAGASAIRIERVGINLCGATKDIDGLYADGSADSEAERAIVENAPDAFFSTFDEKEILNALKAAEIPAKYSYSAGAYICNYLLYSSLEKRAREGADMQIGFIHVPCEEGQREDLPFMPLTTIISALEVVLGRMC